MESSVMKALKGIPIAIFDAPNDPRLQYPEEARKEGIKSILVVPIPIRGEICGVLRLLSRSPRVFDQQEKKFVAALAGQCGIAIENARIYEDQKRQLSYFSAWEKKSWIKSKREQIIVCDPHSLVLFSEHP
jgi:GAF domain-containing protein